MPTATARAANPSPLVEIARHCVIPEDVAFTRYYELIAPQLPGMGITLDQWQEDIWHVALGLREDLTLCCDVMGVTLSIARQAGKTWGIMVGLIAICLSRPGTTVVWSSHHDRTSSETLSKMQGIVEKPAIRPKMRAQNPVVFTDDNRGVHFANGSRILFGARSSGFGRGFSEVDIQVYDECQNLRESALTDMLAAMNVSDLGLAFFMGTPPRPQEVALGVNEAFDRRRKRALEPLKRRPFKGVYVEFSPENADVLADELLSDIDHPQFWELLTQANPSFGYRVGKSAIERLVENMSPDDIRREVFGIWDKTNETFAVVARDTWAALADFPDELGSVSSFGVNATRGGWLWVVACWMRGDAAHVEIALGTQSELEAYNFLTRHAGKKTPIKHDATGAAKGVGDKLKKAGHAASTYTLAEATAGNALWIGMVDEARLTHGAQPDLDQAVRGSKRVDRKGGGFLLAARSDSFDIGPAIAMTEALYAASTTKKKTGKVW